MTTVFLKSFYFYPPTTVVCGKPSFSKTLWEENIEMHDLPLIALDLTWNCLLSLIAILTLPFNLLQKSSTQLQHCTHLANTVTRHHLIQSHLHVRSALQKTRGWFPNTCICTWHKRCDHFPLLFQQGVPLLPASRMAGQPRWGWSQSQYMIAARSVHRQWHVPPALRELTWWYNCFD